MRAIYHPPSLQRLVMGVTALIALSIAVGGLFVPEAFLDGMALSATGPAGVNEVRGQYGGFFLVAALYTAAGATGFIRPSSVLGFMVVLYGGVFLGRMVHFAVAGFDEISTYPPVMQAIHFVDLTGLVLSVMCYRQTARAGE